MPGSLVSELLSSRSLPELFQCSETGFERRKAKAQMIVLPQILRYDGSE